MSLIIDCHGHYTTAPKALEAWRNQQIAGIKDASVMPRAADLKISDDELRESIETNQLKLMKERGSDITLFSPRASFMAHHIGDFNVSSTWAAICNELCFRVSQLFPDNFVPVAMLPQSPGVDPATCIPELEKCVKEYGAVGINLNPDPSGGHWTSPPLTDKHWYPIYEKMVEYDLPAMIHVSTSCNACFHTTGAHYLNADTTAFMQCIQGDLFKDFPTLKFLIPHGGGAVPYHWGRFRGLAQEMKRPLLEDHVLNNIYFDFFSRGFASGGARRGLTLWRSALAQTPLRCSIRGCAAELATRCALRSNSRGELRNEARCARQPRICAPRRHRDRPRRAPPAAKPGGKSRLALHRLKAAMSKPTRGDFTKTPGWLDWYTGPSKPAFKLPAGAVDAHCHVFGPGAEFPYAPERKYTPCDASKAQLFALRDHLGFDKNVIVQATCHGADNRALVDALQHSNGKARGVATVKRSVTDDELQAMHAAGVRGVRFNFVKRLVDFTPKDELIEIANRIKPLGWHVVIYFEAVDLPELWDFFTALPTTVVVDHMGRPDVTKPVDGPEFALFMKFMREHNNVWSKVSCPERLSSRAPRPWTVSAMRTKT
jgi:4-oxalmesaconate hydratase